MTTSDDIKIKLKNITKKWFYLKTEANERFVTNETLNSFANYVSNTLIIGNIVDNLTSNNSSQMLSAKQGKVLNDNKEDKSNKSSSITTDTGSTTKYPTVKAVEDYAQPIGNYLTNHQDITGKADNSDFDTVTATVTYTDNTSETVTFYIVPNNSS